MPVLSRATTFIFLALSIASASFIRIPFSAPRPIPTIIAVGVASPSAQGQAITRTVTKDKSPKVKALSPPKIFHRINETAAMHITAGTNIPAILSASF